MEERIDYYINLNDGVKPSRESLQKFVSNGKGNYNVNCGNKQTNKSLADRQYKTVRDKPTKRQMREVERLNALCELHDVKKIVVAGDLHRGQISRQIDRAFQELRNKGVDLKRHDKIHCSDCRYFSQNIGKSGTCSYTRCTCRSNWGCDNAEPRKRVANG